LRLLRDGEIETAGLLSTSVTTFRAGRWWRSGSYDFSQISLRQPTDEAAEICFIAATTPVDSQTPAGA
jgi:hypothetical protein